VTLGPLLRGTDKVISRAGLEKKLALGRPLRVKLGVDPTSPDLHLGHTVALNKLRQFQDTGHEAVLIIGDFTAAIGDPSGRSELRPPLSADEIEKNAETYLSQVQKILDPRKTKVQHNSKWLTGLFSNQNTGPLRTLNALLANFTVQQLTEREDFSKRIKEGHPLSLLELLYPLVQGYDSLEVKADVEIGGADQLFNLLMGREVQKKAGQEPQVVLTLPLLEGTDGVKKMSKSYGNAIALNDEPEEMFGKIMSLSDDLMWKYYELLTDHALKNLKALHPMEAKKQLAQEITGCYHGVAAGAAAQARFENVFSKRGSPDDIPEHRASKASLRVVDLLVEAGLAPSKNEARRLLQQGAVEVAGEKIPEDRELTFHSPLLVKVGKRQFRKVLPK